MPRSDYHRGATPYQFVAVPKDVLLSAEWCSLSASARVLALDLMAQYTGKNNGRLCPAFEPMKRVGWRSENTLIRAKRALLECSFAIQTRQGHPPRTTDWIGFTWWKLDWERSMDIGPRDFPYLNFVTVKRIDPNSGRDALRAKTLSVLPKWQDCPRKGAPGPAKSAGLEVVS